MWALCVKEPCLVSSVGGATLSISCPGSEGPWSGTSQGWASSPGPLGCVSGLLVPSLFFFFFFVLLFRYKKCYTNTLRFNFYQHLSVYGLQPNLNPKPLQVPAQPSLEAGTFCVPTCPHICFVFFVCPYTCALCG